MNRTLLLRYSLLLVLCSSLGADEIVFANGERLMGKFLSFHSGVTTFQSDRLGLLKVPVSVDMSLSTAGMVALVLTNGKEYVGFLRPATSSGWTIATGDNTESVSVSPSQIVSLTLANSAEEETNLRSVVATQSLENVWKEAADRPRLQGPWSLDSRFATSGVYSTKDRRLIHWSGELDYADHFGTLKVTSERVFSTSTNAAGKSFTDDDQTRGEVNFTKSLSERTSAYFDFQGLHDAVRFIDRRFDASAGGQYQFLNGKRANLSAFLGTAWIHYSYLPNKSATTAPIGFGAVQFGYKSSFHLPGKLIIQHDFTFNQGYRGDGSYLSYADVHVRRAITNWLYLDAKLTDDFDSRAANNAKGNTLRYSAGVGVKFDAF